jgi:membrane protein
VNPIDRAYNAAESRILRLRVRSRYFDHFCRALLRFWEVQGGRLAAAIAYYGFFAIFALLLIGYSVFGILLTNNKQLFDIVHDFLRQNLPFLDVQAIMDSGRTVGIVGLVGLTFTGIGWVEAIRSSQRLIWRVPEQPGYIGVRQALDLLVLIGILLLLAASQLAVYGLERLLDWLAGGWVLSAISLLLTVAVNMLLAAALLAAVPRLRMTVRRHGAPGPAGRHRADPAQHGRQVVRRPGRAQSGVRAGRLGGRCAGLPVRLQPAASLRGGLGGDQPARPRRRSLS